MRRKRLNVTRKAGRLYFRRETRRLHDGTPDGETLWIMNRASKPRKVVPVSIFKWLTTGRREVCFHLGTYHIRPPIRAAHMIREHLIDSLED